MEEDRVGGGGEMMEMEAYTYKECMRNHAAALGTYATDGCGEYIPLLSDPTSLRCEACGCHRNFHRKVMPEESLSLTCGGQSSPEGGGKRRQRTKFTVEQKEEMLKFADKIGWRIPRKDARNGDADDVNNFCVGIGVSRKIFKVWMHNHKSSSSSASSSLVAGGGNSLGAGGVSHVGDSSPL